MNRLAGRRRLPRNRRTGPDATDAANLSLAMARSSEGGIDLDYREKGMSAPSDELPGVGVAVLIPYYNEEPTIADVLRQFRGWLPGAKIYVFDNNSSDRTVEAARAAGAHIFFERRHGKGYVVQSMFRRVEADIYVM